MKCVLKQSARLSAEQEHTGQKYMQKYLHTGIYYNFKMWLQSYAMAHTHTHTHEMCQSVIAVN